jgi:hypothetical protein
MVPQRHPETLRCAPTLGSQKRPPPHQVQHRAALYVVVLCLLLVVHLLTRKNQPEEAVSRLRVVVELLSRAESFTPRSTERLS